MQPSVLMLEISLYSHEKRLRMFHIFTSLNIGVRMVVKNIIMRLIFGTTTTLMIYLPNLRMVKLTLMEYISRQQKDIVLQSIPN